MSTMTPTLTAAARKAASEALNSGFYRARTGVYETGEHEELTAIIARHYEALQGEQQRDLILLEKIKRVAAHEWDASDQMDEIDRLIAGRHCVSSDAERALQGEQANESFWQGYKKRLNEEMTVTEKSMNPSLWEYLELAHQKKITFHKIGVNRQPDGGYHFYIHPDGVSGDTVDFLIWPDPFNHSDMIVNRLDSPRPDVEGFKRALAKAFPAARHQTAQGEKA